MPSNLPTEPENVDLRSVFRHAVSSTWVITSANRGRPTGFTATSVVQASFDPPVVSFSLAKTSSSRGIITASGRVALHLLRDDQEDLAHRFSGDRSLRFRPDGRWFWHADGLPTLRAHVVRLRATVTGTQDAGDSLVLTAAVRSQESGEGDVLTYHDGEFGSLDERVEFALEEAFAQSA